MNMRMAWIVLALGVPLAGCDDSSGGGGGDDAGTDGKVMDDANVPDAALPYDPSALIKDTDSEVFGELCATYAAERTAERPGEEALIAFGCIATGIYSNAGWEDAEECQDAVDICAADEASQDAILMGSAGTFDLGCEEFADYDGDATLGDIVECWEDFLDELAATEENLTCEMAISDPATALFECPESCVPFGELVKNCAPRLEM